MTDLDLISPDILKLVQLFSAQPDLRFPDLDASVLHDAVVHAKERHLDVVRAEAALMAARAALDDELENLTRKAWRAHAYLRVFAENDEALAQRVDDITLPRRRASRLDTPPEPGATPPGQRKRGRPRKIDTQAGALFEAAEASP